MTFVRALVFLLLAGCSQSDPCDAFPDESCVTLEVRAGTADLQTVDQIHVAATSGFLLSDGVSPPNPRRFGLPVQVAVLPGKEFSGLFSLLVRGFLDGSERGRAEVHGDLSQPHQHQKLVATLFENGVPPPDLAGADLFGTDLAGDLSVDKLHDLSVGTVWTVQQSNFPMQLLGVFATAPDDIYAAGGSQTGPVLLHSTGDGNWMRQSDPGTSSQSTVWASSKSDVWVLDEYSLDIMHGPGDGTWNIIADGGIAFSGWLGIYGFSASDFYLVGNGIYHFDGTSFHRQSDTQANVWDVFGDRADDVWAAAGGNMNGIAMHAVADGGWASQVVPGAEDLTGIWTASPTDIYIVGTGPGSVGGSIGVIFHSTGDGNWSKQSDDNTPVINKIWGSSANDIYLVGNGGAILHSTGNGVWTPETSNTTEALYDIYGTSASDIFVVGANGTILHKP